MKAVATIGKVTIVIAFYNSMTCKELGGTCNQRLTARSWDDMIGVMVWHVMARHPYFATEMERMHHEDSAKWAQEMKAKWDAVLAA